MECTKTFHDDTECLVLLQYCNGLVCGTACITHSLTIVYCVVVTSVVIVILSLPTDLLPAGDDDEQVCNMP